MLVCAGSMLAAVSSCEGNEETEEVFTYSASANLTTSTSGNYYDAVMFDYNDAIRGCWVSSTSVSAIGTAK